MERFGHIFVCGSCDAKICDESMSCKVNKTKASVSRVLDGIKIEGKSRKQVLLCSCGETIGSYQPNNRVLKYCLDLDKVRRCTLRASERHEPQPLKNSVSPSPLIDVSSLNKEDNHSDEKKLPDLTTKGEEKTEAELKKTVQHLQEKIREMEIIVQSQQEKMTLIVKSQHEKIKELENNFDKKLGDVVHLLFSNKMDVMRTQEVVMALHSSVNIAPVFGDNVSDIDVSAIIASSLHDSD